KSRQVYGTPAYRSCHENSLAAGAFKACFRAVAPRSPKHRLAEIFNCSVESFRQSRSDARKLASHNVADISCSLGLVLKGQRKMPSFPSSFQDAAATRLSQPLRGWLISRVASRQTMVSAEQYKSAPSLLSRPNPH